MPRSRHQAGSPPPARHDPPPAAIPCPGSPAGHSRTQARPQRSGRKAKARQWAQQLRLPTAATLSHARAFPVSLPQLRLSRSARTDARTAAGTARAAGRADRLRLLDRALAIALQRGRRAIARASLHGRARIFRTGVDDVLRPGGLHVRAKPGVEDRKSVGYGTRVYVRVILCGRLFTKKKKIK